MDEWEKFLRFNLDTIRFNLDTNVESIIRSSLDDAQSVLHQFIHDPQTIKVMNQTTQMICEVFRDRGRIFTCGNGGSMCDAMHFAEEWTGRFRADRQPLPVMALSDPAHLTCVANDFGFDEVFARSITAFGRPGDLLNAISTSSFIMILSSESFIFNLTSSFIQFHLLNGLNYVCQKPCFLLLEKC